MVSSSTWLSVRCPACRKLFSTSLRDMKARHELRCSACRKELLPREAVRKLLEKVEEREEELGHVSTQGAERMIEEAVAKAR